MVRGGRLDSTSTRCGIGYSTACGRRLVAGRKDALLGWAGGGVAGICCRERGDRRGVGGGGQAARGHQGGVAGEGKAASSSAKSIRVVAAAKVPTGMVLLAIVGGAGG
jgi:hypothetical protein